MDKKESVIEIAWKNILYKSINKNKSPEKPVLNLLGGARWDC